MMMNPNDVSEQNLPELISMKDFEWMINEIKDPIGMNLDMYQYIPEPITKEDISSETLPELMSKEDMEWIVNDVKDSIALDLAVYLIPEPKEEMRKKDENLPELISKEDMEWIVNDLKEDPIGMDLDMYHIPESMTKTDMRILRSQMNDIANLLEDFKKTSKDTGMGLIQERLSRLEGQVNMMEKNMKNRSYQTRKDSPPLRNKCIEDQHLVKTHDKKTQKQKSTPCVMLYDVQKTLNTVSNKRKLENTNINDKLKAKIQRR